LLFLWKHVSQIDIAAIKRLGWRNVYRRPYVLARRERTSFSLARHNFNQGDLSMRRMAITVAMSVLFLSFTGCTFPKITITVTTTIGGKATAAHQKTISGVSIADAMNNSVVQEKNLVDVDQALTFDSTTPANATVTVTTDNGQTFAQSFPVVPTDASSFAPATSGTVTNAFVAQTPSDVDAFIHSAASHANSTVTIDVQTSMTFQGPTDGASHTVIGRQYTPSNGVTNIGSATYVAPSDPSGDCGARLCQPGEIQ
jgi:hypothetical protein